MNAAAIPAPTRLAGLRVLFQMAVDAEYGPALRSRFEPLMTGVGPVEAACVTADALARLEARGERPDLVVSLGSAGSARLAQGSVHQAASIAWRDIDASPLGFARGVTPFLDLPAVIALPHRIPGLPAATLSTGSDIVSGPRYDSIAEDMVDMESYAVLRACLRLGLPMIALRGISDGAEELRHLGDWTQYLHVVDAGLADAVDRLAAAVESGALGV